MQLGLHCQQSKNLARPVAMKMNLTAVVVAAVLTACGPDPVLGTYNFTQTGSDTVLTPDKIGTVTVAGTQVPSMSTGTITVTGGAKSGQYAVTIAPSTGSPCTVNVEKGSGDTISVLDGQTCAFVIPFSAPAPIGMINIVSTATAKSGTATVKDNTLTVVIKYDFTASASIITATGNGERTYVGTKAK